jgi:hypothetical protein
VRHQYEVKRDPNNAGDFRIVDLKFDPKKYEEEGGDPPRWFWSIEESRFTHFLFDGSFWVCIFFMLSGFVLTISFFKR